MSGLLSVKTVLPAQRGRIWYADQLTRPEVLPDVDAFSYSFTGRDPTNPRNQWLLEARKRRLPIIYFFGVAPALYAPLFPVFVEEWNSEALKATLRLAPGADEAADEGDPIDDLRRYATRRARQRLHQSMFRAAVVDAYGGRCALSGLPELRLLEAAHIVPDTDASLGQPDVRNGILMSRLHHGAYDAGLIGIDPNYRVHCADQLLAMRDGPMLEALTRLHGTALRLPSDRRFCPDPRRLAERFAAFSGEA